MPIEIREITIRTEVRTTAFQREELKEERDLQRMREQLLEECKKLILGRTKRKNYKR